MALASRFPDVEIPELSVPQFVLAGAARARRPPGADRRALRRDHHPRRARLLRRAPGRRAARPRPRQGRRRRRLHARTPSGTRWSSTASPPPAASSARSTRCTRPRRSPSSCTTPGAKLLRHRLRRFLERAPPRRRESPVDEIIVLDGAEGHASLRDLLTADRARRPGRRSTRPTIWSRCRTPAAPRGCPRASCSPTATSSRTSPAPRCSPTSRDDRVIAVLPFFHIYGLTC